MTDKSTKKWFVTLKPAEKFFFGGEQTYQKEGKTDYFMRSNYFPQQTAVLGMIRYLLLKTCGDETVFKNNRIQNKDKAAEWIGEKSFRIDDTEFNFGKIKSLSPLFIHCKLENKHFFPRNKEYLNDDETTFRSEMLQLSKKHAHFNLQAYEAKEGLADLLTDQADKTQVTYNDFFVPCQQVGIRKNYKGVSQEGAFYIQVFQKFKPFRHKANKRIKQDLHFAFLLELDADLDFDTTKSGPIFVMLGGEQQTFALTAAKAEQNFEELQPNYKPSVEYDKLVLTSDAYVDTSATNWEFSIASSINFRFLETQVQTNGNYYGIDRNVKSDKGSTYQETNKKIITHSKKFELYKRGSVFYGDIAKMRTAFDLKAFKSLGYNHYKPIEKNGNSK